MATRSVRAAYKQVLDEVFGGLLEAAEAEELGRITQKILTGLGAASPHRCPPS